MVAYLDKSTENVDFDEIVDFLNANPIRYALTSSEPTNLDADEAVYEERGGSVEWAATTTTSLDAKQRSGNINRTQSMAIPNVPFPQGISSGGVNTPGSDKERIKLKELMDMCTKLFDRVLDLENVKDAQALEIKKLKKREDASKQGRNEINQDVGISWFQKDAETQGRYGHDIEVNTASTSITTASTASAPITTAGVSVSTAEPRVSRETSTRLARGVIVKEASETATRPAIPPLQIDPKDKAQRLQAELDEKAMLEREREKEAKLQTLLITWG
ncbi:hypothetical protein Tco_0948655 [Tanacetum coccineum]